MMRCVGLYGIALCALTACDPTTPSGPGPVDTDTEGDSDTEEDTAPAGVWSYQAVDGMVCGDGSPAGIGINPGSDPESVFVFMAGGGACWDAGTCYVFETASHIQGQYTAQTLANEVAPLEASPLMDRDDPDNPYRDATFVYVPYCTGDLHSGDSVRVYDDFQPNRPTHHAGSTNLSAALDHVSADLPDATDVWVLGVSAGGYGAQMQAHQFRQTWPGASLRILADSAPMIQPGEYRWSLWKQAWNPSLPPDCTGCDTSFRAILSTQAAAMPDMRFGLATFTEDTVITLYFAQPIGQLNTAQSALIRDLYGADNLSVFRVTGTDHVMSVAPGAYAAADGTVFRDWYWEWAGDGALEDVP